MKHGFVAYILLCGILPLIYGGECTFLFWGTQFDRDYFIRDLLLMSGFILAPCVIFEKNEAIRKKIAIAIMIQGGAQVFSKIYNDCQYDPIPTLIQALVLIGSIYYIYRKNK